MRVTYTADDGTTWDTEAECLGWEQFCELRLAAESTLSDPDDSYSWDEDFRQFCEDIAGETGGWTAGMTGLWKDRQNLLRLAELMRQAADKTGAG